MKKCVLLFPGQGSQYVGMGKSIFERNSIAREVFEEANDILGFDLKGLCFQGEMDELTKTANTQPAILTASVASFRVYMQEFGSEPMYLAGHSLGEISALTCSGALEFADALKITRKRGEFMQDAVNMGEGAMCAISQANSELIEEECKKAQSDGKLVVVSNYNSPDQIVISGYSQAVEHVANKLKEAGARVIPLKVSAPFHSPLMQEAADKLKNELGKYKFNEMKYPVISNVTALPYSGSRDITEYLSHQIVEPVRWQATMNFLEKEGVELAIELGPKNILKSLMKKNAPKIKAYSFDDEKDIKALNEEHMVNGQFGTQLIARCLAVAVCTKNSNWDNEQYRKGVVEPYRKIQSLLEEIEKSNRQPAIEEMDSALQMLKSVFATKMTPLDEKLERFEEIFKLTETSQLFPDFIKDLRG